MTQTPSPHRSVLLDEVLAALAPRPDGIYVDGTFGAGGYTRALLEAGVAQVFAIDRDPAALAFGTALGAAHPGRLTLVEGRFGEMATLLGQHGMVAVHGIALDLGVSSMQLDVAERGFSFRLDGPLDMRMEGVRHNRQGGSVTHSCHVLSSLGLSRDGQSCSRSTVILS